MDAFSSHYCQPLGLNHCSRVNTVGPRRRLDERRVEAVPAQVVSGVRLGMWAVLGLAGDAEERLWRYVDTTQFTTELVARLARWR